PWPPPWWRPSRQSPSCSSPWPSLLTRVHVGGNGHSSQCRRAPAAAPRWKCTGGDERPVPAAGAKGTDVTNVPSNRFRTLVADDAEDMRELIVAALEANGRFEVVAQAADAAEAVARVRELRPHLALVDLGMPVVSGLDVLPELREVSPETRVVVVSGFAREGLADIAATRGAAGFVEKGLSVKRLVDD